jgi:hypothetical protein
MSPPYMLNIQEKLDMLSSALSLNYSLPTQINLNARLLSKLKKTSMYFIANRKHKISKRSLIYLIGMY